MKRLSQRLADVERARGILPDDVTQWTDAELEAVAAEEPFSSLLACLTDDELEILANADDGVPLGDLLPHRAHPREWPEWDGWSDDVQRAAAEAWAGE